MKKYVYELHLHTSETSRCAKASGAEQARHYAALGYAGVIVTDHFMNGNTTVPRDIPWDEQMKLFTEGYESAKAEGEKLGLSVWFGYEFQYGWNHYLTYGITQKTLIAHPEIMEMPLDQYVDWVKSEGGYVVHAHPFRMPGSSIIQMARDVDAIEILNVGRPDPENDLAKAMAKLRDLPTTYGTDNHTLSQKRFGAVTSDVRFSDIDEMFAAIKAGETENALVLEDDKKSV